jgi:leucyl-tRNA synthetase
VLRHTWSLFIRLIAPALPHLAEELWALLGEKAYVHKAPWPTPEPRFLTQQTATLAVQINGKRRGEVVLPMDAPEDAVRTAVLALPFVQHALNATSPRKIIVVANRIVNVVV